VDREVGGPIVSFEGLIWMGEGIWKVSVLVVDDEPLIRMCAVDLLEEAGFSVVEADSGPRGLALFAEHPEITALFTDIQMPGAFDGLALARKALALRPDVQLIITSGNVRPSDDEIPDDVKFVPKPYDGTKIVEMIASHHA
jgi:CheY-like chemotaxis protein